MKLLNWNLEWRTTRSAHATAIRSVLERGDLDVICLTETQTEWLKPDGGWIEAEGDYGYGPKATRRKVALWAREGFLSVTNVSPEGMPPGRFVSGVTTSGVRVVGVCIPWRDAHVSTGRRDRKPWEEHVEYLAALAGYLGSLQESRVVVVGDFNQALPRFRAPVAVYESMRYAFEGFEILTTGITLEGRAPLVDHVAVRGGGRLESFEQLPIVSDHLGWAGDVRFG